MQIQIHTDNHVQHDESVVQHVERTVEAVLGRFASDITRLDVHLSDVNAERRSQDDHVCKLEARLAGLPPLAATDSAANTASAVTGAMRKLSHALEAARGRQQRSAYEAPSI